MISPVVVCADCVGLATGLWLNSGFSPRRKNAHCAISSALVGVAGPPGTCASWGARPARASAIRVSRFWVAAWVTRAVGVAAVRSPAGRAAAPPAATSVLVGVELVVDAPDGVVVAVGPAVGAVVVGCGDGSVSGAGTTSGSGCDAGSGVGSGSALGVVVSSEPLDAWSSSEPLASDPVPVSLSSVPPAPVSLCRCRSPRNRRTRSRRGGPGVGIPGPVSPASPEALVGALWLVDDGVRRTGDRHRPDDHLDRRGRGGPALQQDAGADRRGQRGLRRAGGHRGAAGPPGLGGAEPPCGPSRPRPGRWRWP